MKVLEKHREFENLRIILIVNLIVEIEKLEKNLTNNNKDTYDEKKTQLQMIREQTMRGNQIRSRVEWLNDQEKPSRLFCAIEHKKYLEKTAKKIKLKDGSMCTDQKRILSEFKHFYASLFQKVDHNLGPNDFNTLFDSLNTRKLSKKQSDLMEGPLTIEELGNALKQTKNNKTPGMDGFPADFFKVFWKELGVWIQQALNSSYDKGSLSISLRQCMITCLPKKGKCRDEVKNWRHLSMLSSIHKLASAAIANRMKPYLNDIIDNSQSGFIAGRNIADSTRLVYDTIHITEKLNIPGLLVSIDFQKAFDSISWDFLYRTLSYLGFGTTFLKWIKLFNTNIKAKVLQHGYFSESINIGRGCRQGDPIAPYLFILAAQILTVLILQNSDIRGICLNGLEIKITQYADDTTLLLDGSQSSLIAALNTLEIFGSYSGLKVNTEKTKVIWLGRDTLKINCWTEDLFGDVQISTY